MPICGHHEVRITYCAQVANATFPIKLRATFALLQHATRVIVNSIEHDAARRCCAPRLQCGRRRAPAVLVLARLCTVFYERVASVGQRLRTLICVVRCCSVELRRRCSGSSAARVLAIAEPARRHDFVIVAQTLSSDQLRVILAPLCSSVLYFPAGPPSASISVYTC